MALLSKELLKNLPKLGISSLNPFQTQALSKIISNKNTVLLGEPGIGKTSTYVLAISSLTSLTPCQPSEKFSFSSLFSVSPKPIPMTRPHGALIIVPTHEKCLEVYQKFRFLAPWLNIKKTSGSMSSFIGTFLLAPETLTDSEAVEFEGLKNIAKGVEWDKTDVLLSTPASLEEFLECRQGLNMSNLNPEFIVIDEIDWIFESGDSCKRLRKSFDFIEDCKEKQFVLAAAILPYTGFSPNPLAILTKEFTSMTAVSTEGFDRIPLGLNFEFCDCSEELPKMKELEKILMSNTDKKTVVFSNHVSRCSDIKELCLEKGIECVLLTPNLGFEERIWEFFSGKGRNRVIVGNELACRGLEIEADHVIMYNLPSSVASLVSRIGTVSEKGKVTFLLDKEEQSFKELLRPGEKWTSVYQYFPVSKSKKVHSIFLE